MKREPQPLDPPPLEDAEWALEIVRLWAADGKLHVSMRWDYFKKAEFWGVVLVDFARHIARAWAEGAGRDPGVVMHEIRDAFEREWESPTDLGSGSIRRK
ncbi:MAG: DUF5076 domain-containing protein [Sandaracinaceae bacterium]|nr:DUF5076 domain-containing protein [Sandaracinaceae bacterium]